MPIEQRVIGSNQKIGVGRGAIGAKDTPAPEVEPAKKSKKGLLVAVVAVVVGGGAAAYWFLGTPGGGGGGAAEPAAEPEPVPGAVVAVEPVSLNLADGHYLRLGFELQLTAEVGEEAPDTGRAVDAAIALFSGRSVAEISDAATRDELKAELLHQIEELYEGEVMDLYLTNYVTQ